MKSEQIKEITDRAAEQLVAALEAGHSETLTAYLKAIGRFHRYSLHNVLLIASQKPNASYVAGFRTWNELGRFVKKVGLWEVIPILGIATQANGSLDRCSEKAGVGTPAHEAGALDKQPQWKPACETHPFF